MPKPRFPALFLASACLCYAAETWSVAAAQRDPGAVQELLERASATGARVWRDGERFLVAGALGELPRETGAVVQPFTAQGNEDVIQATDFSPDGSVRGSGPVVTLDHAENAVFLGISFLLDRVEGVAWAKDGTVILDSAYAGGSRSRALNFARQFGLRARLVESAQPAYELKRPRLGVGTGALWVTALLDRYAVPWSPAGASDWRSRFDTVIVTGSAVPPFDGTLIRVPAQPGSSFTRVAFETADPVAFGMPHEEWARSGEPVALTGTPVAQFKDAARPAIVREGRTLTFGFAPDTYATCKLLLNAVYLGSARRL